jgi:hypothetical protein
MTLVEEIAFLIEAQKKFLKGPHKEKDFIKQVMKFAKDGSISREAFRMAIKLFPTNAQIAKQAKELLTHLGEPDPDFDPCGSGSGYRKTC